MPDDPERRRRRPSPRSTHGGSLRAPRRRVVGNGCGARTRTPRAVPAEDRSGSGGGSGGAGLCWRRRCQSCGAHQLSRSVRRDCASVGAMQPLVASSTQCSSAPSKTRRSPGRGNASVTSVGSGGSSSPGPALRCAKTAVGPPLALKYSTVDSAGCAVRSVPPSDHVIASVCSSLARSLPSCSCSHHSTPAHAQPRRARRTCAWNSGEAHSCEITSSNGFCAGDGSVRLASRGHQCVSQRNDGSSGGW